MNIKHGMGIMYKFLVFLLFFIVANTRSATIYAEPTPRWVKKGVKELDKKRSNDTYSFHIFHEEDQNKSLFELNRFKPLLDYVDNTYGVSQPEILVDSIPADGILPKRYTLNFQKDGNMKTVEAILVDSYSKMTDYADNTSDYNFWELYAISNPGMTPEFDNFSLSRSYGAKPVFMSIIPGLGQIYKGQTAKGYSFLGIEAAMVASIVSASNRVHHWVGYANRYPQFYDNYQSKATTFRQWRMFCYITGGALYIYNLFDAAISKGARYVEIKRNHAPNMQFSFTPVFSPDMLGLGINISL